MMEQNQVSDMKTYQGAEEAPESLNLHFIPFNQGMLYVGSTGSLETMKRLACLNPSQRPSPSPMRVMRIL